MRLETIILINRAPFERIQLQFENENVFILSGINGTGKTTILSYIVDAFYELARNSFQNEFEDKQNKYYRVSSGLYSLDNTKASIVYMRFKMDDGTIRDYIDIRGNCNQEEYEELIGLKDKMQFGDFSNKLVEAGNVKHWSASDRKSVQEVFDKYILTYFPAYRYEMPAYMNDPYNLEFYESEDNMGDTTLQGLLTEYTRITPARTVIGIFDRDNPSLLATMGIDSVPYKCLGKNIYAFAIPLVHEMEYGAAISIEHYYTREDLCRTDENERRLFLGDEFFNSGNSKDGKYQTKIKQIQNKTAINGVIDDKVYSSSDLEQAHSLAMSKECFAKRIYEKDSFAEGFDFSCFERIFDIIRAILNETDTSNQ